MTVVRPDERVPLVLPIKEDSRTFASTLLVTVVRIGKNSWIRMRGARQAPNESGRTFLSPGDAMSVCAETSDSERMKAMKRYSIRFIFGFLFIAGALVVVDEQAGARRLSLNAPAVIVTATPSVVSEMDDVTFTARIRPDLAATMRPTGHPSDPLLFEPHLIGWTWVPDLDVIDTRTKGCSGRALTCTELLWASGTMVFSVRTAHQLCTGSVHVRVLQLPDIRESTADSLQRVRADSASAAIRTKQAHWEPCTA